MAPFTFRTLAIPAQRFDRRMSAIPRTAQDVGEVLNALNLSCSSSEIKLLTGGFSNINFVQETGHEKRVIRFYPDGKDVAAREVAILQLAHDHGVRVPKILAPIFDDGKKVAIVMQFCSGQNLSSLLEKGPVSPEVFKHVGRELAKIHSIKFAHAGHISALGKVDTPFGPSFSILNNFVVPALEGRAGERLGIETKNRLLQFVKKNWELVEENTQAPCLVHCDFNPKNILVDEQQRVTIIDWEFSISADGLIDMGNFLRFEEDYSPRQISTFFGGYTETHHRLPLAWEKIIKLHDLVSMCSFLDRPENYSKTFATACYVVHKTLAKFGA